MGILGHTMKLFANAVITSFNQHEPQLKIYGGVIGLIGAGVWACVATAKNHDVLAEAEEEIIKIKEEAGENLEFVTDEAAQEEIVSEMNGKVFKVKAQTGVKVALNYAGPVALAAVSGGFIVSGERKYHVRNLLGVAATREAEKRYDKLLDRIENKYGKDVKNELVNDIKTVKKEETVEDPETGKKKKRNVTKYEAGDNLTPGFNIVLNNENWRLWRDDFETNLSTLFGIQCEVNNDLMEQVAFNGGKRAVKTATEVLRTLEYTEIDDHIIKRELKDKGCVWTAEHPIQIDFDLDGARLHHDHHLCDENEIVLHINFVDNVWAYR